MNNSNVSQLFDVYDVWYKPWWHSKYFYGSVAILLLTVAVLFLYIFWQKYLRAHSLSFEQAALLSFQKLHEQSYDSEEAIRDAYFKVTMIMKIYLSKRYNISLLNKTDQELIAYIKKFVPVDVFATLQEMFERAYQIKFAQAAVSEKMLYDDIDYMQRVIYQTVKQVNSSGDS
ncbi:MAG: hypothetical protein CL947_02560 [Epsilonproteobacteria bacterium]|nr:hypothetical protein [Campylobacterota bacterium]|tara:strand:+ start:1129 stop:1647 length:519 start_codon:yes stop_codon:yes gene_type:complete